MKKSLVKCDRCGAEAAATYMRSAFTVADVITDALEGAG